MKQNQSFEVMKKKLKASFPGQDSSVLQCTTLIHLAANQLNRDLEAAVSNFGINLPCFEVIWLLEMGAPSGEMLLSELAAELDVTAATMTNRIDQLQRAGLAERNEVKTDRRKWTVKLTNKGKKVFAQAAEAYLEANAAFLKPIKKMDRKTLIGMLEALNTD